MKLTTVEGMQSEIFVPITLKPIFTELKKPLTLQVVSTAKIRHHSIHPVIFPTESFLLILLLIC